MTWLWGRNVGLAAGVGAFAGHLWPVWLNFKGGKGVATFLGVLLAVAWQGVILFGVLWLAVAAATRYSSLASLIACAAIPPFFWFWGAHAEALVFLLLVVLSFIMHRGNIARLAQGTESKIGQKAGAAGA
jgi:glycerol-3-phosphate acyltransferase PlsY